MAGPRYSKEEFARRGDAIYERAVRPALSGRDDGKFVAIDIETGAFEVDADEQAASDRLTDRMPDAQVWLRRLGCRVARRFGGRAQPADAGISIPGYEILGELGRGGMGVT